MSERNWTGLLPCPFCNSKARPLTTESRHRGSGEASASVVICTKCGAAGPFIQPAVPKPFADLERQAVAKWNRRGSHAGAEWRLQRIAQILNARHIEPADAATTGDRSDG